MAAPLWTARLSAAAERDFLSIIKWTAENFGPQQGRRYRDVIEAAVRSLRDGPTAPGVRRRNDVADDLWSVHIARYYRRGRHILLFRVIHDRTIEVVRILHDSMEAARHLPDQEGDRKR